MTPGSNNQFEDRSYKLVEANWKGGGDQVWIETNLGATGAVKNETDTNPDRAGWYFQFNRLQGHYYDDQATPGGFDTVDENSGWDVNNDPCFAAFGGEWRVPTEEQWRSFVFGSSSMDDGSDVFNSPLRLHQAGAIDTGGNIVARGSIGYYFSNEQGGNNEEAPALIFSSSGVEVSDITKTAATPVRC
ncbi:MAG: hypothetical protein GVY02_04280, partial [Bacteroidetes bacterium]|nr:hypothetical protein [Bacteroidota bacterium]